MLAAVRSATLLGVEGQPVTVEVHVSNGLPGFNIVGLPDTACRESRDRVRAALLSCSLPWPLRRVTVNLAPSSIRKVGSGLDLAIAVGLLVAIGEVPYQSVQECAFFGELGLDGSVRSTPGILSLLESVSVQTSVVPASCLHQVALLPRRNVRPATSVGSLVKVLQGLQPWDRIPLPAVRQVQASQAPDLLSVKGQPLGRRAVEVAAVGGHHLLLVGPPGAGKSMLARRLPGLLPDLDDSQLLESVKIRSVMGCGDNFEAIYSRRPPFRSPHHGISPVGLIGGGGNLMRPGEISLAHRGVLFLDEFAELALPVLESLRQPMEEGRVQVSRAQSTAVFPCRFQLVAAMNPCPCGEGGLPGGCRCSRGALGRYRSRLSGPILDRFDLRIPLERPVIDALWSDAESESSSSMAKRVALARSLAAERSCCLNSNLDSDALDLLAPLSPSAGRLLKLQLHAGSLSARGVHRVRRVARTVADLDGGATLVGEHHVAEALALRAELSLIAPGLAS